MNKIKLRARAFDGVTLVDQSPDFQLIDGFQQASLPDPSGVLPAGLWGKVPGGDPYLLHINVLSEGPLAGGDFFELQSGTPVQPRARFHPSPSNHQIMLVRPSDRLRLVVAEQGDIRVELLIESIGGVNELGSRLSDWARAAEAAATPRATSAVITGPTGLPAWSGILHVLHTSAAADIVVLPPRGLVPLDALMTFTRCGAGMPVLTASLGDTFSGGSTTFAVNRTIHLMNNGHDWTAVGN